MRSPEVFLADNIADYKESVHNLNFPWYKSGQHMERAYVLLHNIRIDVLRRNNKIVPDFFTISDGSGEDVMYWNPVTEIGKAIHSFEQCREEQELEPGDWIYSLFIRYFLRGDFSTIIELNKEGTEGKEKEDYVEQVQYLELKPVLGLSYLKC